MEIFMTIDNNTVVLTPENIKIIDSYKIKSSKAMKNYLEKLQAFFKNNNIANDVIDNRTIKDLLNEWKTHNLLY